MARICAVCNISEIPDFPPSRTKCDECRRLGLKVPKKEIVSGFPVPGWQRAIIEDLANPFDENDLTQLCKKYNVSLVEFYKFKDSVPDFDGQIGEIADKHKNMHKILFWKSLVKRVKEGDTRAISIYGEITKEYKPKSAASAIDGMNEDDKRKRLGQLLKKLETVNGSK